MAVCYQVTGGADYMGVAAVVVKNAIIEHRKYQQR